MEADWSVDIGPELPWIEVAWSGFLDLRTSPHAVESLPEAAQHPALRDALLALNAPASRLYTSKCDAWPIEGDPIDPDEFSASPQHAVAGFASYIDILDPNPAHFSSFALTERRARDLTARLGSVERTCARTDAVVRRATATPDHPAPIEGYGITLYVAACGANPAAAYASWAFALSAAVAATIAVAASCRGE